MNNLQLIGSFTEKSNRSSKSLNSEELEIFFNTQLETEGRYSTSFDEIYEICEINRNLINQHQKFQDLCWKTLLVALEAEARRSKSKLSDSQVYQIIKKILSFHLKNEGQMIYLFSYIAFSDEIKFSSYSLNTLVLIQDLVNNEHDRENFFSRILTFVVEKCLDDKYLFTAEFYHRVKFLGFLLKLDPPEHSIRKYCFSSSHVKIAGELFWRLKSDLNDDFSSSDIELIKILMNDLKMSFIKAFELLVEFSKMKISLENVHEIFASVVFSKTEEVIKYLADEKVSFDKALDIISTFQKWKTPQPLLQKIFISTIPHKLYRLICSEEQVLALLTLLAPFSSESYRELLSEPILNLLSRSCLMFKKKLNLESIFVVTRKGIKSSDHCLLQQRLNADLLKFLFPLLEHLDKELKKDVDWRESILFFFLAHIAGNSFLQTEVFLTAFKPIMLKFKLEKILSTKVVDVAFVAMLAVLSEGKIDSFQLQEYVEMISPSQHLDKRILFFLKKYNIINSIYPENLVFLFKSLVRLLLPQEKNGGEKRQEFLLEFLALARDEEVGYRLINYLEQENVFKKISKKTVFIFLKALPKIKSSCLSLYVSWKIFCGMRIPKKIQQDWLLIIYGKMFVDRFVDLEILNNFFSIVKNTGSVSIFYIKGAEFFKTVVRKAFYFSCFEERTKSCSMEKRFSLEIFNHYGLLIFVDIEAVLFRLEEIEITRFIQTLRQGLTEKLRDIIVENMQENILSDLALLDAFLLMALLFDQPHLLVKGYNESISKQLVKMEFSPSMILLLNTLAERLFLDEKSKELAKRFFYEEMKSFSFMKNLLDPSQLY